MDRTGVMRVTCALFAIAAIPVVAGWLMVDPARFFKLGLANYLILTAPLILLAGLGWRSGLPLGASARRMWRMAGLVSLYAILGGLIWAVDTERALWGVGMVLAALASGYLIASAQWQFGPDIVHRYALAMLLLTPLYVTCIPVMDLLYDPGLEPFSWQKSLPGLRHVRKAGHLFTISALAGIGLMLWQPRAVTAVLTIFAIAMIFWSGGRGAMLALPGAVIVVLCLTGRARQGRLWGIAAVLILAGLAASFAIPLPDKSPHIGLLTELDNLQDAERDQSSGRLRLWTQGLHVLWADPWQGIGWHQYVYRDNARPPALHVHNILVEVPLALGLPMGLLTLGLLAIAWGKSMARRQAAYLPALMVFTGLAGYALVSGTYFYGVPLVLGGLAAGLCLGPLRAPLSP